MKKTYITTMPDHIGAFLKASRCFSALGINITRVSYNKAVDSHTLFIDAEGTEEQLRLADAELEKIGYLQNDPARSSIVLIEFCLRDVPGSVSDILTLIDAFHFNISYISSQENGTDYQYFKMGLYVDEPDTVSAFLHEAEKLCRVRVIDYNTSEKVYDNSIFYNTYVMGLSRMMHLSEEYNRRLLVHVNLAMQTLDEQGLSPYRTFDSIHKFAELLAGSKGAEFSPRISSHEITEHTKITLIEPPCGSNITIINSNGKLLFVDTGYACYTEEMLPLLRKMIPEFDSMHKTALITHADVDHCGLLPLFDEIITSHKSAQCLISEYNGENGYREENALHKPYISICKLLTSYEPPQPSKLTVPWENREDLTEPLTQIGFFDFEELHFEVYEGKGGHLPGEIVLIDYAHNLALTGDIFINIRGLTPEQANYNQYAPILMTSVDSAAKLCAEERKAILQRLGVGAWKIFSGHGFMKDYNVTL
ncbi:MAG: MBL fold metallo-hydrolase [Ruminococcaceae bacterium]|nr:MBL fold metallo-hydrolase [Oscillospiraceae bacterium]